MYASSASRRPSEWTLREVPPVGVGAKATVTATPLPATGPAVTAAYSADELRAAERVLRSVRAAAPYPSALTGNASASDPRWLRWRFWDECGLLLPRTVLLHSPPPVVGSQLDWQLPTCLLHDVWMRTHVAADDAPEAAEEEAEAGVPSASAPARPPIPVRRHVAPLYSVAVQIFNGEDGVAALLLSLLAHTRGPFELVILFDSAEDESWPRVEGVLRTVLRHCDVDERHSAWPTWTANGRFRTTPYPSSFPRTRRALNSSVELPFVSCLNPWLVHVRVMLQPTPVWETSGNNIQMRAAHPATRYWISVQDDQPQRTRGWNQLLAAPLRWWPHQLLGVSGRCAHQRYSLNATTFNPCRNPSHAMDAAWTPELRCHVYVRDTANRGPLLVDYAALRRLRFFDEMTRRIENDDHDLFARAWEEHRRQAQAHTQAQTSAPPSSMSIQNASRVVGDRSSADALRPASPPLFGSRAAFVPLEWDQHGVPPGRKRRRPTRSANELAWMSARDARAVRRGAPEFGLNRARRLAREQRWPPHDENRAPPSPLFSLCLQHPGPPVADIDSPSVQRADPWMAHELQPWWQHATHKQ